MALSLLCTSLCSGQTSDPVGIMTLNVAGMGSGSSPQYTSFGLGLTRPVLSQGTVDQFGTNTIVNNEDGWTDNEFNSYGTVSNPCYVEFTSGVNAGVVLDIAATSASSRSITTVQNLPSGVAVGDQFKIRQHWTIGSVFGANDQSGLGAGTVTSADEILIWNTGTQAYDIYYYQTSGVGGIGWRKGGSPTVDASTTPIAPFAGLTIKRQQAANFSFVICGSVKTGQSSIPIVPGNNAVANVYATSMTLGDSGLYTGNAATGIAGGTITTADQVLTWDGIGYNVYYYQTFGVSGVGWRSSSNQTDVSGTVIPAGTSVVINRKASSSFSWVSPQHPSNF